MIKVWKEKYHRLSLAKKFSFISILTIVISMFVFTVTIQFFFEKSVLKITSDGYKQKFDVASENSQKILGDADKITKVLLTDDVIQNWFLMDSEDSAKLLKLKLQVEKNWIIWMHYIQINNIVVFLYLILGGIWLIRIEYDQFLPFIKIFLK